MTELSQRARAEIDTAARYGTSNYNPMPLVLVEGKGAWVTDVDGKRYLDAVSAFSATNFGHANEQFIEVAIGQMRKLELTSRSVHAEGFGKFAEAITKLSGMDRVLMMNTGAEANETAIKAARKWGYKVKGIPENQAKIIAMHGNFHGRTTTIMSFSDDENARDGFGPFTPGFELVNYNDIEALEAAIDDNTAAVILEPIQGEGGVIVPDEGYLKAVRELTRERNVLMICDEVQTGMGRTGTTFRFQAEEILPDLVTVAKSLSAGLVPVSAVLGSNEVMAVFTPGTHGSTFGGNPVAVALATAVCEELATGKWQQQNQELHPVLFDGLRALVGRGLTDVRGAGLWVGVDIDPAIGTAPDVVNDLIERGVLIKNTRPQSIRIALPIIANREEIELLVREMTAVIEARWAAREQ
ncbi:ornithine--oxo-acid transaminase [Gulosibacter macacae]|uniref:ornithine aminotransferase n=1 Tax=Gulosibacter macacae TaxID=2488791 RepID=A0A3P3VU34_9MICO|nr:ornithine--oxo-acid transaminase [Gulosibacter macacae]RRJ85964.1 ornithine--oxo-acid transaminase [Gulosibacter macacae]